jgi:hypothetical protein
LFFLIPLLVLQVEITTIMEERDRRPLVTCEMGVI